MRMAYHCDSPKFDIRITVCAVWFATTNALIGKFSLALGDGNMKRRCAYIDSIVNSIPRFKVLRTLSICCIPFAW